MNQHLEGEHTWFRRSLPDHLLDLLVEGERERFERHARGCAPCARLLASALGARADWWDGAGHPPVGVLLQWKTAAAGDRTHELARAHVAGCESCRRDLEDLLGIPAAHGIALAPVARRRPPLASSGQLAIAAGLVTLVAVALLFGRTGERRPGAPGSATEPAPAAPAPGPGSTSGSMGASPAPRTAHGAGRTAEPVPLVSTERGAGRGATTLQVEPGVTRVPLTLPALFVPDETPLEIELHDATGTLVWRQALPAERALRAGGVLLPVEGLAAGAYGLVVRWNDAATGESSREFMLDVRTSRSR